MADAYFLAILKKFPYSQNGHFAPVLLELTALHWRRYLDFFIFPKSK